MGCDDSIPERGVPSGGAAGNGSEFCRPKCTTTVGRGPSAPPPHIQPTMLRSFAGSLMQKVRTWFAYVSDDDEKVRPRRLAKHDEATVDTATLRSPLAPMGHKQFLPLSYKCAAEQASKHSRSVGTKAKLVKGLPTRLLLTLASKAAQPRQTGGLLHGRRNCCVCCCRLRSRSLCGRHAHHVQSASQRDEESVHSFCCQRATARKEADAVEWVQSSPRVSSSAGSRSPRLRARSSS